MTPEEIIRRNFGNSFLCCQEGCDNYDERCPFCRALVQILAHEIRDVILEEREACAKTCETKAQRSGNNLDTTTCLLDAAREIRERIKP